jgi:hypothetical protein
LSTGRLGKKRTPTSFELFGTRVAVNFSQTALNYSVCWEAHR